MNGALEDIRVIELGHWVAVPSASAILADWGAEVIKVENPQGGDAIRGMTSIEGVQAHDVHIWWEQCNRNKKSIAVDLGHPRGREVLHRMLQKADVMVSNFQPAVLQRYNMDYETLRALNPALIYAVLTGYGKRGPDRDKPGYDYAAQWARGGFMHKIGEPGSPPPPQRPGMGDNFTAMLIAGAICAALFARQRTGQGQELAFSLYQAGVWALSMDIVTALHAGIEIPKTDRTKVKNALWNTYRTKDGQWMQMIMLQPDRFWSRFCTAVGRPGLEQDPRFVSQQKREENNEALISILDELLASRTWAAWDKVFTEQELIYGRVQSVSDVVADPQAWENDFFTQVPHPVAGLVKLVASPVEFGMNRASIRTSAPEMGQHTEEVLLDNGYTWEDIAELKDHGVIP